jgi:hypothetical protein
VRVCGCVVLCVMCVMEVVGVVKNILDIEVVYRR